MSLPDNETPFDPSNPFDTATDDLRRSLCACVARHVKQHPAHQQLSPRDQLNSLILALNVTTAGVLLVNCANPAAVIKAVAADLPHALDVVKRILKSGERRGLQ